MKRLSLALLLVMLSMLIAAPSVQAAASSTTITLDSNFETGVETITATGDVLCDSGTAETFGLRVVGGPRTATFHLFKTLTCDDGSGTFTIGVEAKVVFGAPTDNGGWWVVGGTDDYATLQGGGNLLGTYYEGGVVDVYTGKVSL
jgi:hypothetical protein